MGKHGQRENDTKTHMRMPFEGGVMHLQAKEHIRQPEARREHGIVPSLDLQREHSLADTLILDLKSSDHETMNFCCSKPPSMWYFMMAALMLWSECLGCPTLGWPNSYVEVLMPNMMVSVGRAFGMCLR